MGALSRTKIEYPKLLAALGHLIAKLGINDVCILEFENGVIVTGSKLYVTGETWGRHTETRVLSIEDLQRLVKEH